MSQLIRRRPIDTAIEKQIITAMIVSSDFLKKFKTIYKPELFQLELSKVISNWCYTYFDTYEQAPNETIEDIYKVKKEFLSDEDSEAVAKFLSNLSNKHDENNNFNSGYILDKAEKYIQHRNLSDLISVISGSLSEGDNLSAEAAIANYSKVQKGLLNATDIFNSSDWIDNIFETEDKDFLFKLKGNLGKLIPNFYRETLVAFAGPEKRGKSFWLMECALTAVIYGVNVAHFNFEMREEALHSRLAMNLTSQPSKKKYETKLVPHFDCVYNQDNSCILRCRKSKVGLYDKKGKKYSPDEVPDDYENCFECAGESEYKLTTQLKEVTKKVLTKKDIINQIKKLSLFTRGKTIKMQTRPSSTYTVDDIENQLDVWESEGFIADVVVVDYADLLLPKTGIKDYRHGLDDIWSSLKRLAQKRKICVLTATQASKEAYEKRMKQGGLAEDKRKAAHTERIIALNQIKGDKEAGIMRLNILFEREDDSQSWKEAIVLHELSWGKPHLTSIIIKKAEG